VKLLLEIFDMTFKNMKFKVDSPGQSAVLQTTLQRLGYDWAHPSYKGTVQFPDRRYVYTSDKDICADNFDECFNEDDAEEQDTVAFLAAHEPAQDHPEGDFKDYSRKELLDYIEQLRKEIDAHEYPEASAHEPETFFGDDAKELGWFDNTGTMPDLPEGTKINVLLRGDDPDGKLSHQEQFVHQFDWTLDGYLGEATVAKWRYHRPSEASEYFVQPKTEISEKAKEMREKLDKDTEHFLTRLGKSTATYDWLTGEYTDTSDVKDTSTELFEGIAKHDGFTAEAAHEAFAGVKRNKYMREIKPGVYCDVYDVLRAFNVTDGALAHMVKKCLAVGQRGHKDATEDYKDIVASAQRALELHMEWKDTK
jgi:hypothetical protein